MDHSRAQLGAGPLLFLKLKALEGAAWHTVQSKGVSQMRDLHDADQCPFEHFKAKVSQHAVADQKCSSLRLLRACFHRFGGREAGPLNKEAYRTSQLAKDGSRGF